MVARPIEYSICSVRPPKILPSSAFLAFRESCPIYNVDAVETWGEQFVRHTYPPHYLKALISNCLIARCDAEPLASSLTLRWWKLM